MLGPAVLIKGEVADKGIRKKIDRDDFKCAVLLPKTFPSDRPVRNGRDGLRRKSIGLRFGGGRCGAGQAMGGGNGECGPDPECRLRKEGGRQ